MERAIIIGHNGEPLGFVNLNSSARAGRIEYGWNAVWDGMTGQRLIVNSRFGRLTRSKRAQQAASRGVPDTDSELFIRYWNGTQYVVEVAVPFA